MTLRYLLDTSIVSVPARKTPDRHVLQRLEKHGGSSAIPTPVWHELTYGCRRLPSGKRRTTLEAYLRDVVQVLFTILPYDEAAATWHGHERARLEAIGRPRPFLDGQIAAIAKVNELVLVTANSRDFVGFDGLRVEDWTRSPRRR